MEATATTKPRSNSAGPREVEAVAHPAIVNPSPAMSDIRDKIQRTLLIAAISPRNSASRRCECADWGS